VQASQRRALSRLTLKAARVVSVLSIPIALGGASCDVPARDSTPESPPPFLLVVWERLKPGSEAAYDRIERERARICANRKCPHPYLALESLTGPKDVWRLSGFASEVDRARVEQAYRRDEALTTELQQTAQQKRALMPTPETMWASYRRDLSDEGSWRIGGTRFVVIAVTATERKASASVFETSWGLRLLLAPAATRREAEQKAASIGANARIFAVRPYWSWPADSWILADPEFWQPIRADRLRP
jgi:hypothetical protein